MKRKGSQISPKNPSPIRSSFPRGFHGVFSSKTRSNSTVSQEKRDVRCKKRVRFADLESDNLPEASPVNLERKNQAPKSDDPKTSEYAFFKKLKENASHKFHSPSLHQNQSKKYKSSDSSKGRTKIIENSFQDLKSSYISENVTADNFASFLLPLGNVSKKSGIDMNRSDTTLVDICRLQKNMEEDGYTLRPAEEQYKHGELFSIKRQKLRQWVTKIACPEIGELCSKGYDFVSVLLSQLFPQSNEDKSLTALKEGKVRANTESKLVGSPKSDMPFKKVHHLPTGNLVELHCGPSMDVDSSSSWYFKPRMWELRNPSLPMCCNGKTYINGRIPDLDCELGENTTPMTEGDSTSGFDVGMRGSLSLSHLKGMDRSHTKSKLLEFPKPDIHFKKFHQVPPRNRMELEYDLSADTGSLCRWLEIPRVQEFSNSNSPTCHCHEANIDRRITELDGELGEITAPILCTGDDSTLRFLMENHGSFTLNHLKELPLRNRVELEYDPFSDADTLSSYMEIPRVREFSNSNSPTCANIDRRTTDLDNELVERTSPILHSEDDSTLGYLMEKHGSLTLSHLKELDELHYPNGSLSGIEPQAFLLGWDYGSMTDERNLTSACKSTDLNSSLISSSFEDDDEKQELHNRVNMSGLCTPSSMLLYHPSSMPSIPCSPRSSHNLGNHSLDAEDDKVTLVNSFSLPLSCMPNHETRYKGRSNFLSPRSHFGFMSKVLKGEHWHPLTEALFSSELDFDWGWNCLDAYDSSRDHRSSICHALELPQNRGTSSNFLAKVEHENCQDDLSHRRNINHFHEHVVDIHDWSPFYFQLCIDKEKPCPFLLDKPHWDGSEGGTYSDDSEAKRTGFLEEFLR